ncbi:MAG: D-amino acid aminotransferase [Anaerolineae bacterium]|nr:D-amino acid aminotransferase [Anaerolineae bacterium]
MIVYFNGQFIPKENVGISPDDRGFLFADGVYEVIRVYHGQLFQADRHWQRLARSLGELRMDGLDLEIFGQIAGRLLDENHLDNSDALIYIQITRGAAPRQHAFPGQETPVTIYAAASPFTPSPEKMERGVKIILMPDIRWARCDIKTVALLPNVLAYQQARDGGAEEAVFVRDGAITEGTHSNFAAVFAGQLVTYPQSHYILAGITRAVVLDLCRELNIPANEFPIFEKDLPHADEMMLLSTASEITPVAQVDHWQVGNGKPGPITQKLQQAFRKLVD